MSEDDVFCAYCSEPFPADDPMVDYEGADYCSPNCVREMLAGDSPCDHDAYVAAVRRHEALLTRVLTGESPSPNSD